MTNQDISHLKGFRGMCKHSPAACVIGDVSLTGTKTGLDARGGVLQPNTGDDNPEAFTFAIIDFEPYGLPVQGNVVEFDGLGYAINALKFKGPLVTLLCGKGVSL